MTTRHGRAILAITLGAMLWLGAAAAQPQLGGIQGTITASRGASSSSTGTRTCARGFFENRNRPKGDFHRDDYGGSLGGPIRRDRSFFFVSAEIVRELTGNSFNATVETEQAVNWVNANRPNSIAAQLFSRYAPQAARPTTGTDLGRPMPGANVWSTVPDGIPDVGTISVTNNGPRDGNQFNFRLDQVFRDGLDRLKATYYISEIETQFLYVRPNFNHPYPFRNQLFNLAHTWMVSDRSLNEATFGFVRQHGAAGDPTPEYANVGPGSGVAGFGVEFWHPIDFTQMNYQFRNTFTMNRGRHSFRMGGELRMGIDGATLHHWERPTYSFQHFLDSGGTRAGQIAGARVGTVDRLYETDWNNFAPRLGVTWDPWSTGRFVVRSGFGKSYNRINNTVFSDEGLNPPQFANAVGSIQDGTPTAPRAGS